MSLSNVLAAAPTNLQLILQAARAGKLREPEGNQPRGTTIVFFRDGDGYELRYVKHREVESMLARAQIVLPVASPGVVA